MEPKEKSLIIKEINSLIEEEYSEYLIGLRDFPTSQILLNENGIDMVYGCNCLSFNDAASIVNNFIEKGMKRDDRFGQNASRGLFIMKRT